MPDFSLGEDGGRSHSSHKLPDRKMPVNIQSSERKKTKFGEVPIRSTIRKYLHN
jgi:hypothetical protein